MRRPDPPTTTLDVPPRYLLGFPWLVGLKIEATGDADVIGGLPELNMLLPQGPLTLTLTPSTGVPITVRTPRLREGQSGLSLLRGESHTCLLDLSHFGLQLAPDVYALVVAIRGGASEPATFTLVEPTAADAAEAHRLRSLGGRAAEFGAWGPFLRDNYTTVTVDPALGAEARAQLALHIFLHRAFYGPEGVGQIDPTPLDAITAPLLAPEVAALRYEIARASGANATPIRDALLARYPGMAHRIDEVDRDEGFIAIGREAYGREKDHLRPPPTQPYPP